MITVLAVGKKHEAWVSEGIERYQRRLRAPFDTEWILLPHSTQDGDSARSEDSGRILKRIPADAHAILLDERGRSRSSPEFSNLLTRVSAEGRRIVIIIGGAFGVDATIHDRADEVVSLSDMVFPHQLVRLILIEQLYRAQSIATGGKYHHE